MAVPYNQLGSVRRDLVRRGAARMIQRAFRASRFRQRARLATATIRRRLTHRRGLRQYSEGFYRRHGLSDRSRRELAAILIADYLENRRGMDLGEPTGYLA